MKAALFVALLLLGSALATNINYCNSCPWAVDVYITGYGTPQITISAGGCVNLGYGSGASFNIKVFPDGAETLAEFSIDSYAGLDFYDLSVVAGYTSGTGFTLRAPDGTTVTCQNPGCTDAYDYPSDDSKTHAVATGGTFTLTFFQS